MFREIPEYSRFSRFVATLLQRESVPAYRATNTLTAIHNVQDFTGCLQHFHAAAPVTGTACKHPAAIPKVSPQRIQSNRDYL